MKRENTISIYLIISFLFITLASTQQAYGRRQKKSRPQKPKLDFSQVEAQVRRNTQAPRAPCPSCSPESKSSRVKTYRYPYLTPQQGAHKVFAAKFQTCKVLKKEYRQRGYKDPRRLAQKKTRGKCTKATKLEYCMPPQTKGISCPVATFPLKNGELKTFDHYTDCSGFVGAAILAAGLKMNTSKRIPARESTRSIGGAVKNGTSCLVRPKVDIDNLLKAGDIVNVTGRHVIMINRVGKDPFGIKQILAQLKKGKISKSKALGFCKNLNQDYFDFGIIHSSDSGGGSGIHAMRASNFGGATATALVAHARKSCQTFIEGKTVHNYASLPIKGDILRHKGNADKRCVQSKPPRVQGEECINDCFK